MENVPQLTEEQKFIIEQLKAKQESVRCHSRIRIDSRYLYVLGIECETSCDRCHETSQCQAKTRKKNKKKTTNSWLNGIQMNLTNRGFDRISDH